MLRAGIILYVIGLTVFYVEATFERWWWHEIYYLWDKCLLVFLFWGIHQIVPREKKRIVFPVLIFSIIRLVWQIVVSITGWEINDARAVAALFILLSALCSYLTLKGLIKWERK